VAKLKHIIKKLQAGQPVEEEGEEEEGPPAEEGPPDAKALDGY
jgi:hypothetical protein